MAQLLIPVQNQLLSSTLGSAFPKPNIWGSASCPPASPCNPAAEGSPQKRGRAECGEAQSALGCCGMCPKRGWSWS